MKVGFCLSGLDTFYFFENSPYSRLLLDYDPVKQDFFVFKANEIFYQDFDIKKKKNVKFLGEDKIKEFDHIKRLLVRCIENGSPFNTEVKKIYKNGTRFYTFAANQIEIDGKKYVNVTFIPDPLNYSVLKQERDDAQILFNSIFQTSDSSIVVIDHNRRIVRVNNVFLKKFDWRIQDVIGKDFTIIFPEAAIDQALTNHESALKGESSETWETSINRGNGEYTDVLATSAMLEMTQKRRFHMMTLIDISDRKKIERNLILAKENALMASKAKSDFLANMSHELRTPLNAIIGFSEMMMNNVYGPLGSERYQEYLEDVHASAQHLLAIINDVLDMSKIEAGRLELDERVIKPGDLAAAMARIMESRTVKGGQNLVLNLDENISKIDVDERLLRQILMNLLSNAVKFTPVDKEIKLSVLNNDDGGLCYIVEDQGIGIPDDQVQAVMEPFGQVSDPMMNSGQGTGLGLPLAKAMMELHGGSLVIESKQGDGTKVTCCFPPSRVVKE